MQRRFTPGAVLLAGALAVAAPAAAQPGAVGTLAQGFNLEELGGGYHSLIQHRGEVIFLAIIGYG